MSKQRVFLTGATGYIGSAVAARLVRAGHDVHGLTRSRAHARALESLPREERQALTVAEIMRGVYSRILQRIEQSGYRVLGDRVTLTPSHRLAVAAGVWLRSRLPSSAR